MKKIVLIINGKGGVGKDTLCNSVCKYIPGLNISSIEPIKEIARLGGWAGQKDKKSRSLLSKLKATFIEYNDLPYFYITKQYEAFLEDSNILMFVHIREPNEIEKFVKSVKIKCKTILIKRSTDCYKDKILGNNSDDSVDGYNYDYYFYNNKSIKEVEHNFLIFIKNLLSEQGILLE